jgi:RNA polymerase sigma factor (sigma-70 family)
VSLFTDEEIRIGFKENDRSLFSKVYKKCYPAVKRFVLTNSGCEEDAKDLLQDALMIVFQKVRKNQFVLECSFITYLYAIVRNLWLKELRDKRGNGVIIRGFDEVELEGLNFHLNFEKEFDLNVEYFIFRTHFNRLGKTCRDVLRMFFEKIPYSEMAKILNLKSGATVRRRKYRCKEMLIENIKNDPQYLK